MRRFSGVEVIPLRTAGFYGHDGERGQAILEFALVVPVVLLLLFGIIEYGRVFSAQLTVNAAAREGARYGIIQGRTIPQIEERVRDFTVNLDRTRLIISVQRDSELVRVTVRYPVAIVLLPIRGILPETVTVQGTAAMRRE